MKSSENLAYDPTTLVIETQKTIFDRSKLYRNLVVVISVLIVLAIILALVMWSWRPLVALGIVPVAVSGYFVLDMQLVRKWQRGVLGGWVQENYDLPLISGALDSLTHLPPNTLVGMKARLPSTISGHAPLAPEERKASVDEIARIERAHSFRLGLQTAGVAIAMLGVGTGVLTTKWIWLISMAAIPVTALMGRALVRQGAPHSDQAVQSYIENLAAG